MPTRAGEWHLPRTLRERVVKPRGDSAAGCGNRERRAGALRKGNGSCPPGAGNAGWEAGGAARI